MQSLPFATASYTTQSATLPQFGRHIVARFDGATVVVYQAFNPLIASYAVEQGKFAGCPDFKLGRKTWVKPGFLWMMHRSGWATKPNQERVLAITLERTFFDEMLRQGAESLTIRAEGQKFPVQLQWDPDHKPDGSREVRRAIQIGLGGELGDKYARGIGIVKVVDVTEFVRAQSEYATTGQYDRLQVPLENVYKVADVNLAMSLGIDRVGKSDQGK
ncbi:hypothetical protein M427DRAFT_112612 [Gonapodya prolifera JEL478]|uniref:DUF4291 domain-containing protein n=1 Tax=Gonapodya prolifera (strain JEL478) TaxID=1344416 RepID=A0A139ACP2_GONPJ|nr:hypothetical protein M427DRAFT_112612 [Gonapodya prolifera JEL478]|eukprot:KXS14439.1 hypothetical protein M427DRAFT_112612 [Gonapodya prolifera JEL478]